ncbi:MAG TPA: murein biosynthesis integral membrane protein MurJ [Parvularculaceae bacterium]|nr:murein biosynthesis integral membrane protein MurJ [Caulobacterales bacterium]HPE30812.1 murein biosynthesis integral membrane protein MurJ [Parvularculaceae bacterium]HRX38095.1 murein biosynthesis integral membrane protein MurJ [Parvularculaceae bacterium]
MSGNLLKSLATVSGMTMASRVLGFVRQVLIAGVIGAGGNPVADAFWAAFRLPNMFRRLFAEGAFQAAFVPLFQGKLIQEDKEAARRFAEEVMAALFFILAALTAIVEIFAPLFVNLIATGFQEDPEKFALTTLYLRIMFPYLACMSIVGLLSGVLNSLDKFAAYAGAPLILNICQIVAIAVYADSEIHITGEALSWATMVSGVLQLALLVWGAHRQGYLLKWRVPQMTDGVKRLLRLGTPGFISAGAIQINIIIGTNIASREPGAVSWLMNADQLYQLPLSVVGIALGAVLLPMLSRRVKEGDEKGAAHALNRSIELSAFLTLPATAAFIVMASPICDALFRGLATDALGVFGGRSSAFTLEDVSKTGAALAFYSFGLPAFVWHKVFSPAFFAREDTKTPMNYALISIAINIVVALALFPIPAFGFLAVAFATSLAAWVQIVMLAGTLHRRGLFKPDPRLMSRFPRIVGACLAMSAFLWFSLQHRETLASILFGRDWLAVVLISGLGAGVYAAASLGLGAIRISDYKAYARPRP